MKSSNYQLSPNQRPPNCWTICDPREFRNVFLPIRHQLKWLHIYNKICLYSQQLKSYYINCRIVLRGHYTVISRIFQLACSMLVIWLISVGDTVITRGSNGRGNALDAVHFSPWVTPNSRIVVAGIALRVINTRAFWKKKNLPLFFFCVTQYCSSAFRHRSLLTKNVVESDDMSSDCDVEIFGVDRNKALAAAMMIPYHFRGFRWSRKWKFDTKRKSSTLSIRFSNRALKILRGTFINRLRTIWKITLTRCDLWTSPYLYMRWYLQQKCQLP